MSTSNVGLQLPAQLQRTLPYLTASLGLLALSGGLYGLISPQEFALGTIGVPIASTSKPSSPSATASTSENQAALTLSSFVGARNFGSGVTLLTLLYTGQRRAAATALMCGTTTALLDGWICYREFGAESKAFGHVFMGIVCGAVGGLVYYYS